MFWTRHLLTWRERSLAGRTTQNHRCRRRRRSSRPQGDAPRHDSRRRRSSLDSRRGCTQDECTLSQRRQAPFAGGRHRCRRDAIDTFTRFRDSRRATTTRKRSLLPRGAGSRFPQCFRPLQVPTLPTQPHAHTHSAPSDQRLMCVASCAKWRIRDGVAIQRRAW